MIKTKNKTIEIGKEILPEEKRIEEKTVRL